MSFVFEGVTKVNRGRRGTTTISTTVLRDVSFALPEGRSVGILGQRNAGKSTLIRLLSKVELPTRGRILSRCAVSFPVGFARAFHSDFTAHENTVFLARLYGIDPQVLSRFVRDFSELGRAFDNPLRSYSSEKRTRFNFTASYAVPFDCYIADGPLVGGQGAFHHKCKELVRERQKTAGFVFATGSPAVLKVYADVFGLLDNGEIHFFDTADEAIAAFHNASKGPGEGESPDDDEEREEENIDPVDTSLF
jgi:capsular polysaccharide transport system ATP-binding protein